MPQQCRISTKSAAGATKLARGDHAARGTVMTTPPKIPPSDGRPARPPLTARINPKLSANARFQDRAGACKLIETAVARGDQSMAPRLSERRAG
jgi:hypothetical protein